jgi:hypothetical protein
LAAAAERERDEEAQREETRRQLELSRLRANATEWRRIAEGARRELEVADARIDALLKIKQYSKPIKIKRRVKQGKNQSTAVLVASDWHVEEEVEPDQVSGLNRYNLEIAEARIEKFWRNSLTLTDIARSHTQINDLLLLLLGDFYSGRIVEELTEITALSPVEAVMWLKPRIQAGIDYLLEHGDFERITVVGKIGNHSRITVKPRVANAEKHSLEWLLYFALADIYQGNPRVVFNLEPSYHTIIDVYGFKLRVHHGDYLRYQGGIGGLSVPLNRAIFQWNRGAPADMDAMGHWHSWSASIGRAIVNGSLIGYNRFGVKIKAEFEPPQQGFFTISEKYGCETMRAPVFVE